MLEPGHIVDETFHDALIDPRHLHPRRCKTGHCHLLANAVTHPRPPRASVRPLARPKPKPNDALGALATYKFGGGYISSGKSD